MFADEDIRIITIHRNFCPIFVQVEMLLSMEPSGRLLLSPSRGAASRKTDAATRNCGGDPVGYMVKVQGNLGRHG